MLKDIHFQERATRNAHTLGPLQGAVTRTHWPTTRRDATVGLCRPLASDPSTLLLSLLQGLLAQFHHASGCERTDARACTREANGRSLVSFGEQLGLRPPVRPSVRP